MGKNKNHDDDDGFQDYTIVTPLEKLIASIENALRHILTKDLPRRIEVSAGIAAGSQLPTAYSARLPHRLPFRAEPYILSLHVPWRHSNNNDDNAAAAAPLLAAKASWPLGDQPHKLQEWFLEVPCLALTPDSYSGRVLEDEEAQTLLSAGTAALSHLQLPWPMLIPVHDAMRDAYRGVALLQPGGAVMRLETDSTHSRSFPPHLTALSGQLAAFEQRLRWHAPVAAAAVAELAIAASSSGNGLHGDQGLAFAAGAVQTGLSAPAAAKYTARGGVRRSYALPERGVSSGARYAAGDDELELVIDTWDDEAVWQPWAAEDDPVGGLELDALWQVDLTTTSAAAAAGALWSEPYTPTSTATAWRLAALRRGYAPDDGRRPLILLQAVDQSRRFLRLQSIVEVAEEALGGLRPPTDALPGATSFFGMLSAMAGHAAVVAQAESVGDMATDAWWLEQGNYVPPVPPGYVMQDALRELFNAPAMPSWPGAGLMGDQSLQASTLWLDALEGGRGGEGGSRGGFAAALGSVGKAAPLQALASRLALHALRLGTPRAVSVLWARFLRELRFAHVEAGVPLPRMASSAADNSGGHSWRPDHSQCLLQQKLELLDVCIREMRCQAKDAPTQPPHHAAAASGSGSGGRRSSGAGSSSADGDDDDDSASRWASAWDEGSGAWSDEVTAALEGSQSECQPHSGSETSSAAAGEHSAEPHGVISQLGMRLLDFPDRAMNVPATQQPPPITEDALAELADAAEAAAAEAQHQRQQQQHQQAWASTHGALLLSDMQAFKAANPGCRFEDFVRWHSPKDWISNSSAPMVAKGSLSARMGDPQGRWHLLWDSATPVAVSSQRPLFQPGLEGERALHFLETLPPAALHAELLALGVSAAVQTLERAPAARLPAVAAQIARFREIAQCWLGRSGVAAQTAAAAEDFGTLYIDASEEDEGALEAVSGGDTAGEGSSSFSSLKSGSAGAAPRLPAVHALFRSGLAMPQLQELVRALGCVEQCVAAGQSLLQRLTGSKIPRAPEQEERKEERLSSSSLNAVAARVADALVCAALRHGSGGAGGEAQQQQQQSCFGTLAELNSEDLAVVVEEMSGGEGESKQEWEPIPFWTEWCLEMSTAAGAAAGGKETKKERDREQLLHRLFVRQLPGELRVATVITSEM